VPAEPRDAARLLVDRGPGRSPAHRHVSDLVEECRRGDVVVVNDTRVLPARLALRRATGGRVEALVLEPAGNGAWEVLLRPSRRIRVGERLLLPGGTVVAEVVGERGEGRWLVQWTAPGGGDDRSRSGDGDDRVDSAGGDSLSGVLERHGEIPLPPYIHGPLADPERYQTVYARRPASGAAPTAGLHLTHALLERLAGAGVPVVKLELVVGLGTFRPITAARVEDHVMHTESYRVPPETIAALGRADRVLAVGTTVVRALESWAATGQAEGRTDLFIRRGHRFAVVDRLLTNFHVPRSSLLVLIDAFVGPRWRELYEEALRSGYRFLSLGDAMLLERNP
jgi:S-adenosylmethionine:tRNA ribosyltransferase-isomerase